MRIALVCPYDIDTPGGVQSHVMHLAEALRRGGDDVCVVAPGRRPRGPLRTVGGAVRIPFNDSVAPVALAPRARARTRAALADFSPDVVHVHEPAVPWVSLAALDAVAVPVVATFHAWSDRDRLYRLAQVVVGERLRGVDAHLAVSPAAATYHARVLGLPERAFEIVPNGVDVERFRRAEPFRQMQEQESLLFVGRLERRKGLEHLVRAYTMVKSRRPGLRLYVVGDGPDRDRCQSLLPARLRTDVVFLGRVDDAELPRFYASCDLFVAPALGGESFGIVLIEALAAGRPVVASNIPGYASVLTDGVDGRLVPPGDPHALATAIESLLDNPRLAAALAEEGQAGVGRFDWSSVAARARRVYTRVVGDRAEHQ